MTGYGKNDRMGKFGRRPFSFGDLNVSDRIGSASGLCGTGVCSAGESGFWRVHGNRPAGKPAWKRGRSTHFDFTGAAFIESSSGVDLQQKHQHQVHVIFFGAGADSQYFAEGVQF